MAGPVEDRHVDSLGGGIVKAAIFVCHDGGAFQWIDELHCTSETELYIGEIQNCRMTKLTIKAPRQATSTR